MIELEQNRRRQMDRALRWSFLLFAGFLFVTQQVYSYGPLVAYDKEINSQPKPQFEGLAGFILRRLDDLGLRGQQPFRRQTPAKEQLLTRAETESVQLEF